MLRISSAEVDLRIQKQIKTALDEAVIFGTDGNDHGLLATV